MLSASQPRPASSLYGERKTESSSNLKARPDFQSRMSNIWLPQHIYLYCCLQRDCKEFLSLIIQVIFLNYLSLTKPWRKNKQDSFIQKHLPWDDLYEFPERCPGRNDQIRSHPKQPYFFLEQRRVARFLGEGAVAWIYKLQWYAWNIQEKTSVIYVQEKIEYHFSDVISQPQPTHRTQEVLLPIFICALLLLLKTKKL